ncbi:MAG: DNA polymerase II large subunit, partial [Nanoarchaeota archaeon]
MADQNHSEKIGNYFSSIEAELDLAYNISGKARALGLDPEDIVDIPLTRTLPERVESLVASVIPQLKGSGVAGRITELERKHGAQAWDVALIIALEVAKQQFCKFNTGKEAIEAGIRMGFAYATMGIVSAPLEGFIELKIKKRRDGKEYFALIYAGPVRGAGGTAAAVSLLIADYVRTQLGYDKYDANENEVARAYVELVDYHERVTNLQYKPSQEETKFLVAHLPVEIDGDPTEEIEVSNYKDIPRIETNRIRGGMCLVLSMVALKAPKLWKTISKFPKDYGLDWSFLQEFMLVQKKAKAQSAQSKDTSKKLMPDFTYIADLVAGRPVLSFPLRSGGFRLRYGRSRISGYSAASLHPSTLVLLDKYIATGTQLKTERPGKAAAITPCDSIEPPIVKLTDGSVVIFDNEQKEMFSEVQEILYLGDMLVSYGDFFDRVHPLVPAGYCEEWYVQEFELACQKKCNTLDSVKLSDASGVPKDVLEKILKMPLKFIPSAKDAIKISLYFDIPLHPKHTYFFSQLTVQEFESLFNWFKKSKLYYEGEDLSRIVISNGPAKRSLELLGIPHKLVAGENVVIEGDNARILFFIFRLGEETSNIKIAENSLLMING